MSFRGNLDLFDNLDVRVNLYAPRPLTGNLIKAEAKLRMDCSKELIIPGNFEPEILGESKPLSLRP